MTVDPTTLPMGACFSDGGQSLRAFYPDTAPGYFGDGWDKTPGDAPQWHGDGTSAWFWVNHEYVSGDVPTGTTAPTGQHKLLAAHLRRQGVLSNDVTSDVWDDDSLNAYVQAHKQQVGGSWLHAVQDPATGAWALDRGQPAETYANGHWPEERSCAPSSMRSSSFCWRRQNSRELWPLPAPQTARPSGDVRCLGWPRRGRVGS